MFKACAEFRSESLEDLNLENGKHFTAKCKLALKKCEDLYAGVIDKVRKRHQQQKQSVEEKAKIKTEKEEALKKLDPKESLKRS